MKCPNCGAILNDGAYQCARCNYIVNAKAYAAANIFYNANESDAVKEVRAVPLKDKTNQEKGFFGKMGSAVNDFFSDLFGEDSSEVEYLEDEHNHYQENITDIDVEISKTED